MQKSFSDLEYAAKKKLTRRDRFLATIDEVTPWTQLFQQIEPFYAKAEGAGRPPIGLARMLRMYVAQQCFGLSDEGIEDAIYDSQAVRGFVGTDLNRESVPDATTLLKFRPLLPGPYPHDPGRRIAQRGNDRIKHSDADYPHLPVTHIRSLGTDASTPAHSVPDNLAQAVSGHIAEQHCLRMQAQHPLSKKANMDTHQLRALASETLGSALASFSRSIPDTAMDEFKNAAASVGRYDHYKFFSPAAQEIVARIAAENGEAGRRAFLRATIASSVLDTVESTRFEQLPPHVARNHRAHLERIAGDADHGAAWLDINHDLFQKEFGLASLRLYAAGSQIVDYRCGIPRSLIFREGSSRMPGRLMSMMKMGGFRPYFQIHTHTFNLGSFNEAGWEECYRCCAELYALHPKTLGMFGSSWFYDPALDSVSPRLAYLRQTPLSGGARLFFMESGGQAIDNSISTSPTRRSLYEAGKYMPTNYMLVWDKASQQSWAAQVASLK